MKNDPFATAIWRKADSKVIAIRSSEPARIIEQLNGLSEVEAVVMERRVEIEDRIKSFDDEKTDIDGIISDLFYGK